LTTPFIGLKALRVEKLNRLSGGVNSLKLPRRGTTLYLVGFVLFLIVFAFLLLTFTRRVEGHSMLPTLEDGDLVILQPTSMNDVKIGDIIVYTYPCYSPGTSVIHRVLDLQPSGFITKGDNNQVTDQVGGIAQYHDGTNDITSACLEGKVMYVIPYVERLASLPYGVNYILVILIVLAVVYTEFRARPDEDRKAASQKTVPVD
jgi:signal peptidase I